MPGSFKGHHKCAVQPSFMRGITCPHHWGCEVGTHWQCGRVRTRQDVYNRDHTLGVALCLPLICSLPPPLAPPFPNALLPLTRLSPDTGHFQLERGDDWFEELLIIETEETHCIPLILEKVLTSQPSSGWASCTRQPTTTHQDPGVCFLSQQYTHNEQCEHMYR